MDILSDKNVIIRKTRRCYACLRVFKKGTLMRCQVNTYDGIGSCYCCATCQMLLDKFPKYFFDEEEHIYPESCVFEILNDHQANNPEELLTKLMSL